MAINRLRAFDFCYCHLFFCLLHYPTLLSTLSFDFPNFVDSRCLNFTGDAVNSGTNLSLTVNTAKTDLNGSAGRAVYQQAMYLWDRASGKVADFDTKFTFSISTYKRTVNSTDDGAKGGDGFAFFLAPVNVSSQDPKGAGGACLGIINNCSNYYATGRAIVAVEFDTYQNDWDPDDHHVGIDVNSIVSVANVTWSTSIKNGSKGNAWITYNSSTRNLSLFLSYAENPVFNGQSSLSHEVDLSKVLPEWVAVGFSAATGKSYEKHHILSWQFNSTGIPDPKGSNSTDISDVLDTGGSNSTKITSIPRSNVGLLIGCAVGGSVVVALVCLFVLAFYRRRVLKEKEHEETDDSLDHEFEQGTWPKRFSYNELIQATNNFDEARKLGEGGFGEVYRGHLPAPISREVAVKRLSKASKQGKKEYMAEVKIVSRLRHRNLVQLLGWCHGKGDVLLVYEFMPNGSLDFHLFKEANRILWPVRYKIALGLASALLYLHEEWEKCVLHRDIKSSNLMLDSSFDTKLGDFGLARFMEDELGLSVTRVAGTPGYMAPECITGKASRASDVYGFGVVLLEIACSRRAMEERVSLVAWVWNSYGSRKLLDVVDKRLGAKFDTRQMECLLTVGLWCAHPDHTLRPSIRQDLQALNFEAPLPQLPLEMPVIKYDAPTSSTTTTEPSLSVYSHSSGQ